MLVNFEQNRMVRTIQNFELFDKKWLTVFDKVSTPFWKTFLYDWNNYLILNYYLKTIIFQCSKNYGSPTRVTRLKVAPNMTDPISLNEKRSRSIKFIRIWSILKGCVSLGSVQKCIGRGWAVLIFVTIFFYSPALFAKQNFLCPLFRVPNFPRRPPMLMVHNWIWKLFLVWISLHDLSQVCKKSHMLHD